MKPVDGCSVKPIDCESAALRCGLSFEELGELAESDRIIKWQDNAGRWYFDQDEIDSVAASVKRLESERWQRIVKRHGTPIELVVLAILKRRGCA